MCTCPVTINSIGFRKLLPLPQAARLFLVVVTAALPFADSHATSCEHPKQQAKENESLYNLAAIVAPANDTALRSNAGNLTVLGQIDPQLQCGHRVQLVLDGAPAGVPAETAEFSLLNIDRGTHWLQLRIIDATDAVLFVGAPSTFHLLRHSRLHP